MLCSEREEVHPAAKLLSECHKYSLARLTNCSAGYYQLTYSVVPLHFLYQSERPPRSNRSPLLVLTGERPSPVKIGVEPALNTDTIANVVWESIHIEWIQPGFCIHATHLSWHTRKAIGTYFFFSSSFLFLLLFPFLSYQPLTTCPSINRTALLQLTRIVTVNVVRVRPGSLWCKLTHIRVSSDGVRHKRTSVGVPTRRFRVIWTGGSQSRRVRPFDGSR